MKAKDCYKKYIKDFIDFEKLQAESYKLMIEKKEKSYEIYSKASKILTDKKEQAFVKGNVGDWKIKKEMLSIYKDSVLQSKKNLAFSLMFPKENDDVLEKCKHYGYYANKLHQNGMRMNSLDAENAAHNILKLVSSIKQQYSEQIHKLAISEGKLVETIEKINV